MVRNVLGLLLSTRRARAWKDFTADRRWMAEIYMNTAEPIIVKAASGGVVSSDLLEMQDSRSLAQLNRVKHLLPLARLRICIV